MVTLQNAILTTNICSLLSGAVASNDPTRKSFFQAQLVRAIYQMGASEFRRIKGIAADGLYLIRLTILGRFHAEVFQTQTNVGTTSEACHTPYGVGDTGDD